MATHVMIKKVIRVTATDIKRAAFGDAARCPIALALRRAKAGPAPSVGCRTWNDGAGMVYDLPKKAQTFIQRFDDGKKVKPFSFVVRL